MVDYFNAMDPENYETDEAKQLGLGVGDVGMSVPLGISAANVAGIYAKIRAGAGKIELGFPGAVRGQRQAQTPEMYGEDQRQAIRELGAANEVQFTTHSSYGIMGLSGFTGDNPYNVWFQKEYKKQAVDEIKRAIEFARDTAGGGSVVVHTGEVERPISDQPWARNPDGTFRFKQYEEEEALSRVRVVDDRTGQVTQIRKNVKVARPKWLRAEEDYWGYDTKGSRVLIKGTQYDESGSVVSRGDYVDYLGRKIPDDLMFDPEHGRVPVYNEKTGRFANEMYNWDMMVEETNERNRWKAKMLGKDVKGLTEDEMVTPDEVHVRSTMETQEGHARGWSMQYGIDTNRHIEALKKIEKALDYYRKLEAGIPEEDKWRIKKEAPPEIYGAFIGNLIPPESKNPVEILEKALEHEKRALLFARQSSASQLLMADDNYEQQQHMISAHKYAIREAVKGYAEAGIHAMDCTVDPKRPIMITMENIFPERYGGHPEELKKLIRESREEMVERLSHERIKDPAGRKDAHGNIIMVDNPYKRSGVTEEQARKEAEEHIKATLDTGHLNVWRKYWKDDPDKSIKENDESFKRWIVKEVEDLAKNKMVGNVHLTDNFGYQDDHLAPGQGTTPVTEIIKVLKKHGYKDAWTVEPGADASTDISDFHGLMKAWRHFGSPVYGVGMGIGAQGAWTDIQYSYFGQNRPPYYVFGAYSPSPDWTLWSATPME